MGSDLEESHHKESVSNSSLDQQQRGKGDKRQASESEESEDDVSESQNSSRGHNTSNSRRHQDSQSNVSREQIAQLQLSPQQPEPQSHLHDSQVQASKSGNQSSDGSSDSQSEDQSDGEQNIDESQTESKHPSSAQQTSQQKSSHQQESDSEEEESSISQSHGQEKEKSQQEFQSNQGKSSRSSSSHQSKQDSESDSQSESQKSSQNQNSSQSQLQSDSENDKSHHTQSIRQESSQSQSDKPSKTSTYKDQSKDRNSSSDQSISQKSGSSSQNSQNEESNSQSQDQSQSADPSQSQSQSRSQINESDEGSDSESNARSSQKQTPPSKDSSRSQSDSQRSPSRIDLSQINNKNSETESKEDQSDSDSSPRAQYGKKGESTIVRLHTEQYRSKIYKSLDQGDDDTSQLIYFGSDSQLSRNKKMLKFQNKFKRVSNIYFLLISILTFLPFTPKEPTSMISTFIFVLVFTMLKEAYEDYQRYKQDKEINNKTALVLNNVTMMFEDVKWEDIQVGTLIKLRKEESAPADILMLYSANHSGVLYVDTMNLDGETSLKDKQALLKDFDEKKLVLVNGGMLCDKPNENLEKWEGNLTFNNSSLKQTPANIKNLVLRGSQLRNTSYGIGLVVYTGMDTKIMKNLKKPKHKVSNTMKIMNKMLYTVFAFQLVIIMLFAGLNVNWTNDNYQKHLYLDISVEWNSGARFLLQMLVFWVAYSHMIPISLYVIIEMLKLGISIFINKDIQMYDSNAEAFAECKNSDLVEELGQIEMIFSDKTGTLTQNKMIFRKCQINGLKYGEPEREEDENEEGMVISGIKATVKIVKEEFGRDNFDFESDEHYPYVSQFFLNLAICNTVMIEKHRYKKEISYKATSPDELALVKGAKNSGIQLVTREHDTIKIYNMVRKRKETYKLIAEFPFDSDRKRMSILVKDEDGLYILFTKGADSVMMNRINYEKNGIPGLREIIEQDMYSYSCEGLRTLVMANRVIHEKEYKQFKKIFFQLKNSRHPQKEEKLNLLYDLMEQKLRYLGTAAIEDKLQEGVPVTIAQLLKADIRFFMLTGDKQETAVEIARSCRIIQDNYAEIILNQEDVTSLFKKLQKVISIMGIDIDFNIDSLKHVKQAKQTVIVDGVSLSSIFSDERLSEMFFHVCIRSKSVVCCRMSPKQKADIVTLFKYKGKWITLAIDDGANDVSMLIEADIGIGIKGKEGTQAARAADFSISQFRFLMRLVLYHGRLSYLRVSRMICYYFYKNIVLVFTELYFPFYNGFSGQIFFLDWLPMMFNAIFTSWYCLFSQLLEKDVNPHYSYRYPVVYKVGQLGTYFNHKVFWKWIILAFVHGAVCFYFPIIASTHSIDPDATGRTGDHWLHSLVSFSLIIHLVLYKLLLETTHLNSISIILGIFSILLYYGSILFGQIPDVAYITQVEGLGLLEQLVRYPYFWLMITVVPFLCLLPDITIFFLQKIFYPSPVETVLSRQHFDPHFHFDLYHKKQVLNQNQIKRKTMVNTRERKQIINQRRQTVFGLQTPKIKDEPMDILHMIKIEYEKNQANADVESSSSSSEDSESQEQSQEHIEELNQFHNKQSDSSSLSPGHQRSKRKHQNQQQDDNMWTSHEINESQVDGQSDSSSESAQDSSDEENKEDSQSKEMPTKRKKRTHRDQFEQSQRSLNMSIRSNQELINSLNENDLADQRRSKKRAIKKHISSEDSAIGIQKAGRRKKSIFSSSMEDQEQQDTQLKKVKTLDIKSKNTQTNKGTRSAAMQDKLTESQSHQNSSLKNKTISQDDHHLANLVSMKPKVPKINLFKKIFKGSRTKLLNATVSAFDTKRGGDLPGNQAALVVDQLMQSMITSDRNNQQNVFHPNNRAGPEIVATVGHPLESTRRREGLFGISPQKEKPVDTSQVSSPRKKKYVEKYSAYKQKPNENQ